MTTMLSPIPNRSYSAPSGNVYLADQWGVIPRIFTLADISSLEDAGCIVLTAGLANGKVVLLANQTYYVRSDGDNANDGLSDTSYGAWATLQYAYDWIATHVDQNGFTAKIKVGLAGIYEGIHTTIHKAYTGPVYIEGDLADDTNVVIEPNFQGCINLSAGGVHADLYIKGCSFAPDDTAHSTLFARYENSLYVGITPEDDTADGSTHIIGIANSLMRVQTGANIELYGDLTIQLFSNPHYLFFVSNQSSMIAQLNDFTVVDPIDVVTESVLVANTSTLSYSAVSFTGTVTGIKYLVKSHSVYEEMSETPGDVAGSTESGGVVIT